MKLLTALIKEKYDNRMKLVKTTKTTAQKELEELKDTKKIIGLKNARGVYTDEDYQELLDEINSQIAVKEGVVAEMRLEILDIETILAFARFYLSHLDRAWTDASFEGRIIISGSIFPDGLVVEKDGFRTARLARYINLTKELLEGVSP